MDEESAWVFQESSQSPDLSIVHSGSLPYPDQLLADCILCRRMFFPDNLTNEGFDSICICEDCKAMFLDDLNSSVTSSRRSRPHRGRRSRYRNSDSIEDLFSQQFSQLINLVRQNQDTHSISASEHQPQQDGDSIYTVLPVSSSRTTPNRSGRWRRVLSDNESEGFGGNLDSSLFGESDSNFSFGGYGTLPGDSDAISFSAYGGESDASVDGQSLMGHEMSVQADIDGSNSETDIDPMHAGAGLDNWNSDGQDEEDDDWEQEPDLEDESEPLDWMFLSERSDGNRSRTNRDRHLETSSPGYGRRTLWRMEEIRRIFVPNILANMEESVVPTYMRNSSDYLNAREFEELLQQLAETDNSRRGAPPASKSFVESLPRVIIQEEHNKHGGLLCAVCKDSLTIDTEASQLPCAHLYHPSCILPWLSTRNTCPVCRYELPTNDKDYEEGKQNLGNRVLVHEIRQQVSVEQESLSDILNAIEVDVTEQREGEVNSIEVNCETSSSSEGGTRGGWLFLAAAPIVSIVGIVLVLWFRNPLSEGRIQCGFRHGDQQLVQGSGPASARDNRSRRWWSLF